MVQLRQSESAKPASGAVRRLLLGISGAALAACLGASPALAQDAADEDQAGNLQEITVTAQRRSENLQDVPISVSAVTSDTLERSGISSTLALPRIVPSIQMVRSGIASIFFIRGVGNSSGGTGEEGANAFYIDGVYLADLQQANTEFNNIERVEVLKGPQGTLFGRNASGGLVNVITREPGDEFVARLSLGYGNYDTYKAQAYLAGPLSDTLSVDLALTGREQKDGYGVNLATGEDTLLGWAYGVRSKLVYRPGSDVKLVFAGDYWRNKDTYGSGFTIGRGAFLAAPAGTPLTTPGAVPGPTPGSVLFGYAGDYNTNSLNPQFIDVKVRGASLTASVDFDFGTLTNITAYRHMSAISNVDSDYGPQTQIELYIPSFGKTFQEELRLASSSDGPLTWQLGLFYYWQKTGVRDQFTFGTAVGGVNSGQITNTTMKTNSYSAFGEATYAITPTTHLTAGLRYTKEERDLVGIQRPFNQTSAALITAFTLNKTDHIEYKKLTFRAAIRQDLSDYLNVYASFNRGFKAGLWQLNSPAAAPVRPQTTDAFEVGFKGEFFDRMLRVNGAYYHYDVKDYQVRAAPGTSATPILLNATDAKIDGFEASIQFAPTRNLLLFSDVNILNARFGKFLNAPFTYPNAAVCDAVGTAQPGRTVGPLTGGSRTCLGDASGNRIPLSPKFVMNLGVNYTLPLGGQSEVVFQALLSHNSGYFFEQDNRLDQPKFNLLSGSIEFKANERWSVNLWANNITNKHYWLDRLGSSTADRGESAAPRTFGLDVRFNY